MVLVYGAHGLHTFIRAIGLSNQIDGLNYGHWIDYGVKFPCMVTAHQILVGVRFYIATRIWWVDLIERRA